MDRVVVFDSGIGGFSILKPLLETEFRSHVIYLADQQAFPYGDKSASWLRARLQKIASYLNSLSPDLVVIACNTATVGGVSVFRDTLTCPVVAVEPVIKPLSLYKRAVLLGTSSTLSSPKTLERLKGLVGDSVVSYTPHGLPLAIENIDFDQVKSILTSVKDLVVREKVDAIGLSCTHYPLVKKELSTLLPGIELVDPSPAVVSQILSVLPRNSYNKTSQLDFYTTGDVLRLKSQIKYYLGLDYNPKKVVV